MIFIHLAKILLGIIVLLFGFSSCIVSTINILNGYTKRVPVLFLGLVISVIGIICIL
ncbi:hypothetical protein [Clostridium perfringens]|uniref:hypothetical protein n=1 Tax=Clostridium perfringens TaxID=1502 RepID=UPI00156EEAE6|nr:hypothetical protein [Clostridium perfringens]MDU7143601.1 hypothetical protein [Anaerococcus vaginalis]MDU7977681.1 hypothetical protein [Clostridioides difficile]EGS5728031.1 hypothetical protein [Clostridium perfringens]EGT0014429.1 hypothetical protein [Clostridium perfringens]MBI6024922.1 hypothetical protein [Clostridium perfringens]